MSRLFIHGAAIYALCVGIILKVFLDNILPVIVFPLITGAVAGELTGKDQVGATAGVEAGLLLSAVFIASVYAPVLLSPGYSSVAVNTNAGFAIVCVIEFAVFGFIAGYLGGTLRDYILPYT